MTSNPFVEARPGDEFAIRSTIVIRLRWASADSERCDTVAMTSDLAVNLLDTFPGRMLIDWWGEWRALHPEFSSAGQYADSIDTEDYSGRVAMVLHMYLYGGDFKDVIDLDTTDPDIVEMSEAVAAALCSPSREILLSPQSHHGNLTEFRTLSVANRHRPSALPYGALWTATKFCLRKRCLAAPWRTRRRAQSPALRRSFRPRECADRASRFSSRLGGAAEGASPRARRDRVSRLAVDRPAVGRGPRIAQWTALSR